MAPWHEGIRALLSTARSLMWKLLVVIGHINHYKVVHGDISLDTILIKELENDHADILIGGFSECALVDGVHVLDFSKDSLDVFKVVKAFLERLEELTDNGSLRISTRKGWLGHPYLDELWQKSIDGETWTFSTLDICKRINLQLDDCDQPWESLTVERRFDVRTRKGPHGPLFNVTDLIECIQKDTQGSLDEEDRKEVDAAIKIHLKPKNHTGYCSEAAFNGFRKHVRKRTDKYVGLAMAHDLGKERAEDHSESSLSSTLLHHITCYLPSRIFNITQLLQAVRSDDLVDARPLLSSCTDYFEVRGDPSLQGIYMPLRYLEKISGILRLGIVELVKQTSAYKGAPVDLTGYDYQHWVLLADRGFSVPARLNRTTREVTWDGRTYALVDFLRTYMPSSTLDVRPHSLEPPATIFHIPIPKSLTTKTVTYNDSCESIEDPLKFKLRPAGERTAEWISNIESARVTRKKLMDNWSAAPVSAFTTPTNIYSSSGNGLKDNKSGLMNKRRRTEN